MVSVLRLKREALTCGAREAIASECHHSICTLYYDYRPLVVRGRAKDQTWSHVFAHILPHGKTSKLEPSWWELCRALSSEGVVIQYL